MKLRHIAKGVATFVPGVKLLTDRRTGGTDSARYCYSVWLRHLTLAHTHGLVDQCPAAVAELGPGDSIGIGIAALLSGAESYTGLDLMPLSSTALSLDILDRLVELFRARADIPDAEFPQIKPKVASLAFPAGLLSEQHLERVLAPVRIDRIRRSVASPNTDGSMIRYAAPWHDRRVLAPASIDMICSQSVLEYVEDLPGVLATIAEWLRPAGLMSHQVDLRSMGMHPEWNGNWTYSDIEWRLVQGRRDYTVNRAPYSAYEAAVGRAGFRIVAEQKVSMPNRLRREDLAPRFRGLSDDDLTTAGLYFLASMPSSVMP